MARQDCVIMLDQGFFTRKIDASIATSMDTFSGLMALLPLRSLAIDGTLAAGMRRADNPQCTTVYSCYRSRQLWRDYNNSTNKMTV